MQNVLEYITSLNLKAPAAAISRSTFRDGEKSVINTPNFNNTRDQLFVADKSTLSFVSGVTEQNREDVLQSTLLAQLAANKQFPDSVGSMDWCSVFANVLSHTGWVVEGSGVSSYKMKGNIFSVNLAILEVMVSAFGQNYLSIIKSTIESIGKLSDKDNRVQVFEKNTHSLSKGFFQIGLVSQDNDAVSLQIGAFFLNSSDKIGNILFFKSSNQNSSMDYFSRKATLSPDMYKNIRQAVSAKLGTAIGKFVDEIEIAV